MNFRRYALYYMPPADSDWGRFCTRWLGWDAATGTAVTHPDLDGLPAPVAEITRTPRKYGLHATMKPPFALAAGAREDDLSAACAALCSGLAPVVLDGLSVERLGGFVALRPRGEESALNALAAACVRGPDRFRALPDAAELDRRRAGGLTPAQEQALQDWGYPYVMDQFRFHITLSGRLGRAQADLVRDRLRRNLDPLLPQPFTVDALALAGEDDTARFHLIHRYALGGVSTASTC